VGKRMMVRSYEIVRDAAGELGRTAPSSCECRRLHRPAALRCFDRFGTAQGATAHMAVEHAGRMANRSIVRGRQQTECGRSDGGPHRP